MKISFCVRQMVFECDCPLFDYIDYYRSNSLCNSVAIKHYIHANDMNFVIYLCMYCHVHWTSLDFQWAIVSSTTSFDISLTDTRRDDVARVVSTHCTIPKHTKMLQPPDLCRFMSTDRQQAEHQ